MGDWIQTGTFEGMSGVLYVIVGAVLWGVAAVASKIGVTAVGPWAAVSVRSLVFATIVLGYVLCGGSVRFERPRPLLYATAAGVSMGVGVVCVRFAYSLYEVSRVVPIQRLSVVVTVLIGITLLNEVVTMRKISDTVLAIIAVLLLSP
jgi:transporter family protein